MPRHNFEKIKLNNTVELVNAPTTNPEIKIDKSLRDKSKNKIQEESQVTIHCSLTNLDSPTEIRIWKSTYLYAKESKHRSKLVYCENISLYPIWMSVGIGEVNFTLIFTGLPKDCNYFDLFEKIPEPGGFLVKNIKRNNSDVYFIEID